MDNKSLAHTRWNCQYHIVFITKYRKKVMYGKVRADMREILRTLCNYKKVEIIEGAVCKDHVHLCVSIPPKICLSEFMGYLKGKSSLMIFDRHANLKYKYGNRHFWCRGYYVSTVGGNKNGIAKYIRDQEKEDMMCDQISFKEYMDPFKDALK